MAARSALGRAPHKTAGGLLFVAGTTIVMGIITAEALYTAAYDARMEISDLGASETGVILQPSSTIFNATMLAAGAMILAAAWFAHQALHRRAVTIPTGLLGIGVLGVGVFPGNIHPQHPLFAFTAFVAGGLAVLLSAKVTPQPLRAIFAVMGTASLSFTLAACSYWSGARSPASTLAAWSGGWSTPSCSGWLASAATSRPAIPRKCPGRRVPIRHAPLMVTGRVCPAPGSARRGRRGARRCTTPTSMRDSKLASANLRSPPG
jgi:hypothetical membrane protein